MRLKKLAWALWLPLAIIVFWWFASRNSTSPFWPPLSKIASTFGKVWFSERLWTDLVPSTARFGIGFLIAVVVGIALGLLIGQHKLLRLAVEPMLDFLRSLPKPAIIPILIVLMGIDDGMKIFTIAFSALWPILLNTIDGVRAVDEGLHDTSSIYGLTWWQRTFLVVLPAASPQIFVGMRLSLSIALVLMIVSEMMASTNGLGYFVLQSQQTYAIPEMWSGIILLGMIGYATNFLFGLVENKVLAWHKGWRGTAEAKG